MNLSRSIRRILLTATVAFAACSSDPTATDDGYTYRQPADLSDGLTTSAAQDVGIDAARLADLVQGIRAGEYSDIHSILLYRGDRLVLEEYFEGVKRWDGLPYEFNAAVLDNVYSVTKSFTSAAIGLAIQDGVIRDVDVPVRDFFPEHEDLGGPLADGSLTVRHLLTMSAGLDWNELDVPYSDPSNAHQMMNRAPNQIRYVLERPYVAQPGERFYYNSGLTHTLGEIVARATGETLSDYVAERLFTPLGIQDFWWYSYENGLQHAGGGLHMRPRDMLKFGALYLNDGVWNGTRVMPEGWVGASSSKQAPDREYGYQWWRDSWEKDGTQISGFSAQGLGGQFIFIVPDLDLVAVFTGNHPQTDMFLPFTLMSDFVLPAVER